MIIQKSLYKKYEDRKNTLKTTTNKALKNMVKNHKVGKYRYHITDNDGYRHLSMIRLSSYDDPNKLLYEIYGIHGQDTKSFDTYNQAIKFINDFYDGKIKHVHRCECGECWESN